MASLSELGLKTRKFTIDNSPFILTAIGASGVVATGVFAFRGGLKAARILEDARYNRSIRRTGVEDSHFEFTAQEKLAMTWRCYVPACTTGLLTIGAIVSANQIGTRRAAAMALAYSVSEKAFDDYRDKVKEKMGATKEQAVRDDVAQDHVNRDFEESKVVIVGTGEQLCYDDWSGRFFNSTVEDIKHAVNRVNYQINHHSYASLSDFYDFLGLPPTGGSDEVGWTDRQLFEAEFSTVLAPSGKPAVALLYKVSPVRDYFRLG